MERGRESLVARSSKRWYERRVGGTKRLYWARTYVAVARPGRRVPPQGKVVEEVEGGR